MAQSIQSLLMARYISQIYSTKRLVKMADRDRFDSVCVAVEIHHYRVSSKGIRCCLLKNRGRPSRVVCRDTERINSISVSRGIRLISLVFGSTVLANRAIAATAAVRAARLSSVWAMVGLKFDGTALVAGLTPAMRRCRLYA